MESEERLQRIIEYMPVMGKRRSTLRTILCYGIASVNGFPVTRQRRFWRNPRAWEMLYPDEEYRNQIISPDSSEGNYYYEREWKITCKSGEERTVSWSDISSQVPVPGWRTWSIGVDVSKRRHAERERTELQLQLQYVMDSTPIILWAIDRDGIFTLSEGRGLEELGLKPKQVIGMSALELYQDEPSVLGMIQDALAGKAGAFQKFRRAGRWWATNYAPLLDSGG